MFKNRETLKNENGKSKDVVIYGDAQPVINSIKRKTINSIKTKIEEGKSIKETVSQSIALLEEMRNSGIEIQIKLVKSKCNRAHIFACSDTLLKSLIKTVNYYKAVEVLTKKRAIRLEKKAKVAEVRIKKVKKRKKARARIKVRKIRKRVVNAKVQAMKAREKAEAVELTS